MPPLLEGIREGHFSEDPSIELPDPPVPPNMMTKDRLMDEFLFGIPMKEFSTTCEELPDAAFRRAISAAYTWIETEVGGGLVIIPKNFPNEQHPYFLDDYRQWAYINAYHYPIIKVFRVGATYPTGQDIIKFPNEWVRFYAQSGQIQLVPSSGSISEVIIGRGGTFLPLIYSGLIPNLPQLWQVYYSAGYETIPGDIDELVGYKAGMEILGIVSDILYPPGLSSLSVSIDGVSQSLPLTRGKELFGSRMDRFQEHIKNRLPQIRNRYTGIRMSVA